MFPDVSGLVTAITNRDYNLTILIAIVVVGIIFLRFLIRLIKQMLLGGTKKVLIEFFYTSVLGSIIAYLMSIL